MKLILLLQRMSRISPLLSILYNKITFPRIHCGILVDLQTEGNFLIGEGVRIGAHTRIYIGSKGGIYLGNRINIGRDVHLQTNDGNVKIGNGTSIQDHCRLYGDVNVGSGCLFAPNVFVSSGAHVFEGVPHLPIYMQEKLKPKSNLAVRVNDDCWIGANVVIMPGVEIGKGSIVGAGSVVTNDVTPYSITAGVPARFIRKRFDFAPPSEINAKKNEDWPYFYSGFDASEVGKMDREGYSVDEAFELALDHTSPTRITIFARTNTKGATLQFCNTSVTVDREEKEFHFNVPMECKKNRRYKFKVSGRVQILRALLT